MYDEAVSELVALNIMRPAGKLFAIVPNDAKDLLNPIRAIYVGVSGDVKIDPLEAYLPYDFKVSITNLSETISESVQAGGEIYLANGGAVPAVGDIFEVLGTGDFKTIQDLVVAKGAAVAIGDQFRFPNVGIGTEAVNYIADGSIVLTALASGIIHPIRARRVYATGTAALNIFGIL